jgi:MYXO-CTERM domain-containing protein
VNDNGDPPASGCGCKLADQSSRSTSLLSIGLLGLLVSRIRRRRQLP